MKQYSEQEIVDGVASHDNKVLQYIYKNHYPFVENYVFQQGGSTDQAKDLFQDGMIIMYKRISSGKFNLSCKFSTFLVAVCKRIWIQERKKIMLRKNKSNEASMVAEPDFIYGEEDKDEFRSLFDKHFKQLSPECQNILSFFFNDCTNEEIRKAMDFPSIQHVVDRKYRCKKNLIERIKNDPLFKKYLK